MWYTVKGFLVVKKMAHIYLPCKSMILRKLFSIDRRADPLERPAVADLGIYEGGFKESQQKFGVTTPTSDRTTPSFFGKLLHCAVTLTVMFHTWLHTCMVACDEITSHD